jgi:hypothetical protein
MVIMILHSSPSSVNRQSEKRSSHGAPNDDDDAFGEGRPMELEFEPQHHGLRLASCDAGFPVCVAISLD